MYKRLVVIIVVGIADLYMAKKREQMLVIHKIQSVTEDIEMKRRNHCERIQFKT